MLSGDPGTILTGSPAHSAIAASSVKSLRPAAYAFSCAARIGPNGKPCGVCAACRPVRGTVSSDGPVSRLALQRVGNGQGGQGAVTGIDRRNDPVDQCSVDKRTHAVVDEHDAGFLAVERLQGKPGRFLPRRPAGHDDEFAAEIARGGSEALYRQDGSPRRWLPIAGWLAKASIVWWSTARPPILRYCFGPSSDWPARSPRPAATMTTATVPFESLDLLVFSPMPRRIAAGRAQRPAQSAFNEIFERLRSCTNPQNCLGNGQQMKLPGFCA